jgi:hypothetical protein
MATPSRFSVFWRRELQTSQLSSQRQEQALGVAANGASDVVTALDNVPPSIKARREAAT